MRQCQFFQKVSSKINISKITKPDNKSIFAAKHSYIGCLKIIIVIYTHHISLKV